MIDIDSGVPIPDDANPLYMLSNHLGAKGRPRPTAYPWPEMQPGDSVYYPHMSQSNFQSLRSSVSRWLAANPRQSWRWANEAEGKRVWRRL